MATMMAQPSDNLFVSELPQEVDQKMVEEIFGAYGNVASSKFLPGQGKNAALIRFMTLDEAKWIVENLNGNIPQGLTTPVNVKFANPPGSKGGEKGKWGGGWGGDSKGSWGGDNKGSWGGDSKGSCGSEKGKWGGDNKGSWGGDSKGSGGGDKGSWGGGSKGSWGGDSKGSWGGDNKGSWGSDKGSWGADKGNSDKGKGGDRWTPYGKGAGQAGGMSEGKGEKGIKLTNISIQTLKKGLQMAEALPGGKWSNDDGALWIGGLPPDTTDLDLYHIFSPFGAVPSSGVRAMLNEDGTCKGFGFVNFVESAAAQQALETLNGTVQPDGKVLQVKVKAQPKGKGGPQMSWGA